LPGIDPMNIRAPGLALATILLLAASAAAAPALPKGGRAELVQKLADCRKITEDRARLACYDTAASALDEAEAKGDVVVVERAQAREVRRQAFGFSLPSLDIFDRGGSGADDSIDRITAKAVRAYQRGDGKWVFELEDGAVWTQVDDAGLPKGAHGGSVVAIRKASLGSFFMNVDGQKAIRATRAR
jgi:hypothetical protein